MCGYKEPELIETVSPDRITLVLRLENEGNPSPNEGNPSPNEGNPTLNESNPSLNESNLRKEMISNELLSKADEKIYSLIKEDNTISIKDISDKLGLSHSTVERAIKKLKTLGYVKRIGTTRGTWAIIK